MSTRPSSQARCLLGRGGQRSCSYLRPEYNVESNMMSVRIIAGYSDTVLSNVLESHEMLDNSLCASKAMANGPSAPPINEQSASHR